jgi:hypothetical protein
VRIRLVAKASKDEFSDDTGPLLVSSSWLPASFS